MSSPHPVHGAPLRGMFDELTASVRRGRSAAGERGTMDPEHPAWPQFARGTLLDVLPLSGPEGVGLGALGARAGTDAVALGLLVLGLAYTTGVAGGPAMGLARAATRYTRTRLGRSHA